MSNKKRPGFVGYPATFDEEMYLDLKWIKERKGGSMNQRVVAGTAQVIKETLKEIGPRPSDWRPEISDNE